MTQRRLTGLGGFVFTYFRQLKRQALLGNHCWNTVFVIYRERLAPVTLTAEYCVTQTVVHLDASQLILFYIFLGGCNSLLYCESVQVEASLAYLVGTG